MSTGAIIPTKVRRYLVQFNDRRIFVNTVSKLSALSIVRHQILAETLKPGEEPHPSLASQHIFDKAAEVTENSRW